MCEMDIKYKKEPEIFKNHPVLSAQMRAILLDWIMDVCEAYNLHRETLHLAVDYLDRYLSMHRNIMKRHLQLIGISCLFIAAKIEEIYPPKLSVFAYVTDGACTELEILDMELVIMKTLRWKLTPITAASWLNVYLQILGISPYSTRSFDFIRHTRLLRDLQPEDSRLVKPHYSGIDYVRAIRIIDLTSVDIQSLKFSYSTLAAAAIFHTKGRTAAIAVSGFSWEHLGPCVHWMAPFAQVCKQNDVPDVLPGINGIPDESRHLIQAHCVTLAMLEQVQQIAMKSKICSPLAQQTDGILTPPNSGEKKVCTEAYRRCK
jgi:cyclin E